LLLGLQELVLWIAQFGAKSRLVFLTAVSFVLRRFALRHLVDGGVVLPLIKTSGRALLIQHWPAWHLKIGQASIALMRLGDALAEVGHLQCLKRSLAVCRKTQQSAVIEGLQVSI
jgi:hypothetical protein